MREVASWTRVGARIGIEEEPGSTGRAWRRVSCADLACRATLTADAAIDVGGVGATADTVLFMEVSCSIAL